MQVRLVVSHSLVCHFNQNAGDVMSIFASYKLDDVSSSRKKGPTQPQVHKHAQNFFAKYLTSEKVSVLSKYVKNFFITVTTYIHR